MSISLNTVSGEREWWESLGLRYVGLLRTSKHEFHVEEAVLEILRRHPPIAFAGEAAGETIVLPELAMRVHQAADAAEIENARQQEARVIEQREFGWSRIEDALRAQDADDPVTEGRWAGFTHGEAIAWCWNLFQYEPHGFVHPGSEVRVSSMAKLQNGEPPEVFGYPERARELADRGLGPREYRRHQEALGANVYLDDSANVMGS